MNVFKNGKSWSIKEIERRIQKVIKGVCLEGRGREKRERNRNGKKKNKEKIGERGGRGERKKG